MEVLEVEVVAAHLHRVAQILAERVTHLQHLLLKVQVVELADI
jgi:hypothetical protein